MPVSMNVLGYTVHDKTGLIAWVKAARPKYVLVMDDLDLASAVEAAGATVIFRRYRPDDHRLYETMTPDQFLISVADVPASYVVQALNEPDGDAAKIAVWSADLCRAARRRGRRVAVPNYSVGNPGEWQIHGGVFDGLIRAIVGYDMILALHAYFRDRPAREPFHVQRHLEWRKRAAQIGAGRLEIVLTEAGKDFGLDGLGGGHGDGWRGDANWSEDYYADRFAEFNALIGADVWACVFGWGAGFPDESGRPRWEKFNVEGAARLLARLAALNGRQEEDAMPLPDGWKQVRITSNSPIVNIRALPSLAGRILAQAPTGYAVRPNGSVVTADKNRWQPVLLSDCRQGFISLDVSQLV